MTRNLVALAMATLALGSFAAGARADCPHSAPTPGSACVDPGFGACTYTQAGDMIMCSCRDGHWACEPMPAPRS